MKKGNRLRSEDSKKSVKTKSKTIRKIDSMGRSQVKKGSERTLESMKHPRTSEMGGRDIFCISIVFWGRGER